MPYEIQTNVSFEVWSEDIPRYDATDIGAHLIERFVEAIERVIERFEEECPWHEGAFPPRRHHAAR